VGYLTAEVHCRRKWALLRDVGSTCDRTTRDLRLAACADRLRESHECRGRGSNPHDAFASQDFKSSDKRDHERSAGDTPRGFTTGPRGISCPIGPHWPITLVACRFLLPSLRDTPNSGRHGGDSVVPNRVESTSSVSRAPLSTFEAAAHFGSQLDLQRMLLWGANRRWRKPDHIL